MKKKASKSKKVSNEELARMIAAGFASTATKEDILLLNKRLDATKLALETKIETAEMRLEGKLTEVLDILETVGETEITDLQNRMVDAERNIRVLVNSFRDNFFQIGNSVRSKLIDQDTRSWILINLCIRLRLFSDRKVSTTCNTSPGSRSRLLP